jgi:two-component system OmpR family sensor kinase
VEVDVEVLLVEALQLRRAPANVHELVMRTADFFASQAKSGGVDLTIEQAEGVPKTVVLDEEKIAWALSTLVVNALRYAKSHVGVSVAWDDAKHELIIEVSDDGKGIPEDKMRWLFERNPASGQSAGLALPMVRDVMAAHRGSVTLENRPNHGAAFTLRLPVHQSRSHSHSPTRR